MIRVGTVAQFAVATMLPVFLTALLLKLREGRAKDLGNRTWQILCGVAFGVVAIVGTEFGIDAYGATMNVRDAAPIVAGLLFGPQAGILAGLMGGIERWFSVLWGRGMFTRLACSIATCAAGVYAATLNKYVFEGRRPSWSIACAIGFVAEVLHLLLVFLTHPGATAQACVVVRACTFPMILCNGLSVAFAVLVALRKEGLWPRQPTEAFNISQVMQSRLLRIIVIGFVASASFTWAFQESLSQSQTANLLTTAIDDAKSDLNTASDDNLLSLTLRAGFAIPQTSAGTQETINTLLKDLGVNEINVVDKDGIIVASSDERLVGFDMASGTQSSEFLALLPGGTKAHLVQEFQAQTYDANVWRKYAGVRIKDGFVQVAYDAGSFLKTLARHINNSVSYRHVGQSGALVVVDPDGSVAGTRSDLKITSNGLRELKVAASAEAERSVFTCTLMGVKYYAAYSFVEGFQVFALLPVEEANLSRDGAVLMMAFMELLVFAALYTGVFLLVRSQVVKSIWKVNETLDQITKGDLEAEVAVRNNAEFISLSDGINTMVVSLRNAIAAEAARIDRELGYAASIQESALPRTFPPFPEIPAFDIYASMNAAREVGGDFYDFFLIDDHTLGFLIADVSGKGIPASLFMMAAKAELANYMSGGMSLTDAVQAANWHLCQGNDAGMFVTVWAATLDYNTGELTYVNAGHNPPLLRHDGTWQWLRAKGGLFLGTFDSALYRSATLTLVEGDELLLYTDGVNEAFSVDEEQYGDDRLEAFLIEHKSMHPHPLVEALRADLASWAEGAEQSDDITMLALEFGVAPQATGSLTVPAQLENLGTVLDFLHAALRDRSCPISTQNQIDIVIEELFVNVCNYAYADSDEEGTVEIEYIYNVNPNALTVSISDSGVPFDPLKHTDPVTPASVAEAKIGGLGIFMVKRMTDDLSYVRDDNKNVVAFTKGW